MQAYSFRHTIVSQIARISFHRCRQVTDDSKNGPKFPFNCVKNSLYSTTWRYLQKYNGVWREKLKIIPIFSIMLKMAALCPDHFR